MEICFEGLGQVVATFRTEDKLLPGMAVTLKDSGAVELGEENGSPLCGVTVGAVRNGAVAVQIGGAVKVACSGEVPDAGWQELACDGTGKVTKPESGGMTFLVLAADKDEHTAVIRL